MEILIPVIGLAGIFAITKTRAKNNNAKEEAPEAFTQEDAEPIHTPLVQPDFSVNDYSGGSVYTDKFFNPTKNQALIPTTDAVYTSLTGEKVNSDYFKHSNMVPFGKKNTGTAPKTNEYMLDNMQGAGSQSFRKVEQAPMFAPSSSNNYGYGAPNNNDFYQGRVEPSMRMANVTPFDKITRDTPGLGIKPGEQSKDGYNNALAARDLYMDKSVNDLRVLSHQKSSEHGLLGHEGPGIARVTYRGEHAEVDKNRPDTYYEMGRDRLFTTMGAEVAPPTRGIIVEKNMNRPDTIREHMGVASSGYSRPGEAGEYMPSTRQELGAIPIGIASAQGGGPALEGDYEMRSSNAHMNNRTANGSDDYFGQIGGAFGAMIAPILDVIRPSKKENAIGNIRPYENAYPAVHSTYLYNPADRPAATMREGAGEAAGVLNALDMAERPPPGEASRAPPSAPSTEAVQAVLRYPASCSSRRLPFRIAARSLERSSSASLAAAAAASAAGRRVF